MWSRERRCCLLHLSCPPFDDPQIAHLASLQCHQTRLRHWVLLLMLILMLLMPSPLLQQQLLLMALMVKGLHLWTLCRKLGQLCWDFVAACRLQTRRCAGGAECRDGGGGGDCGGGE